jgi:tetratricopeptide (TPR) repeat protein
MNKATRKVIKNLLASAIIAPMLVGCMDNSKHDQMVAESNSRWRTIRHGLILPMAQRYFDSGDLNEAEKAINDALVIDPDNYKMYLLAGRISLERGLLERSYLELQKAIDLDTKHHSVDSYYYQGIVLQRWKKYDKALACYDHAYKQKSDNAAYLLARCEMLVALDRQEEAINVLVAKQQYFDQSAGIRDALGHLHAMKGQHQQAAAYFHEATLLDDESLSSREDLGKAQLASGQHSEAARTFKLLLNEPSHEGRADIRRLLAQAYLGGDQRAAARQIYVDLTRHQDSDAQDWIHLGEMAWQDGDSAATLTAANRAIRLAPQNTTGYLLAGMVWQKRNRLENALRNFDRAAELAPADPVPCILRGISLQGAGRLAGAREAFEQAVHRDPDDRRARRLLQKLAPGS